MLLARLQPWSWWIGVVLVVRRHLDGGRPRRRLPQQGRAPAVPVPPPAPRVLTGAPMASYDPVDWALAERVGARVANRSPISGCEGRTCSGHPSRPARGLPAPRRPGRAAGHRRDRPRAADAGASPGRRPGRVGLGQHRRLPAAAAARCSTRSATSSPPPPPRASRPRRAPARMRPPGRASRWRSVASWPAPSSGCCSGG